MHGGHRGQHSEPGEWRRGKGTSEKGTVRRTARLWAYAGRVWPTDAEGAGTVMGTVSPSSGLTVDFVPEVIDVWHIRTAGYKHPGGD